MPLEPIARRLSDLVFCVSLLVVNTLFCVPVHYAPKVSGSIAVILITTMCLAAWNLGAAAVWTGTEERRTVALAGALLVTPWVLFSRLAGLGPPMFATPAENKLRFLILFVSALAVAGGLIILHRALRDVGERFHSTVGFAAAMLAAPLYLTWATIAVYVFTVKVRDVTVPLPAWIISLADLSEIPLFFGGVLAYVASGSFAMALGRVRWLGRRATRFYVVTSWCAVLFLVVRGIEYPNFKNFFQHWYAIPGFVVGIPAVPWIMPCLYGVVLLRRAGHEPAAAHPGNHGMTTRHETGPNQPREIEVACGGVDQADES